MGYYHIELSPFSKRLCTIVMPFGKYEYQRLPMGLCNSPDIFQVLLYPDFNKPVHIHTDARHYQLGAVISQDNRQIAFYSRKLQPAQVRYTTTERELLSIIETLKEF
jgi:hypothetical protein